MSYEINERSFLSTPSLGITFLWILSGANPSEGNFQLPLSGSRASSSSMTWTSRGQEKLSTPSLGITGALSACPKYSETVFLSTPSLGITLLPRRTARRPRADFQLPLSGSRWKIGSYSELRGNVSFNSLSRDHGLRERPQEGLEVRIFQLPLSGSRARTASTTSSHFCFQLPLSGSHSILGESANIAGMELSTPSLGITEPDSGIFRLSAAFCRGASSHK